MNSTIWKITRSTLAIVVPIILVTIGIQAADNLSALPGDLVASFAISGNVGPCSKGMVFIDNELGGFCIDVFESSPSGECLFANPVNAEESQANINASGCVPVSVSSVIPWRNISQNQAQHACKKAGKRLPSNKEWYQASLGTPDPLGVDSSRHLCVLNRGGSEPSPTGAMGGCVSPSGAYDMIGNAWEWVDETIFDGVFNGRKLPHKGYVAAVDASGMPTMTSVSPDAIYYHDYFWIDHQGARAMFRGGYWGNDSRAGVYAVHAIGAPNFWTNGVGFRCVQ